MASGEPRTWTCPHEGCGQTVRGSGRHLRVQQRIHAARHQVTRGDLIVQPAPVPPPDLTIPTPPKIRRRTR